MLSAVSDELVKPPPPSGTVPVGQVAAALVCRPAGFVTSADVTCR
jgi:hypothetical protein